MEMLKLSDFLKDKYVIGQNNDSKLQGKEIIFKNVSYDNISNVNLGDTNAQVIYNLFNVLVENLELDVTEQEFEVIADKCQKKEYLDLINAMFSKFEDLCYSVRTMSSMENKFKNLVENKIIVLNETNKEAEQENEIEEDYEETEELILDDEQDENKSNEIEELMEMIKQEDDPTKMLELMDKLKQLQD